MLTKAARRFGVIMLFVVPATAAAAEEYVFGAPPRGAEAAERQVYDPIARVLSEASGKRVVYRYPDNWLSYQQTMQQGGYDVVFDGPHFVAWRMAMAGHEPLVRLAGKLVFVIAVLDSNAAVRTADDLAGRTVCALAPPNLATLTVLSLYDNPSRQPILVPVKSFEESYQKIRDGGCVAGVWRDKLLKKFGVDGLKIIYTSAPVANQAFSAGARFSREEKARMSAALQDPANPAFAEFNKRFNRGKAPLEKASIAEYQGLWRLLKDVWGFEVDAARR